ncbi:MAG TPA: EAL domain-containing protein [Thermoleophilaceae bacterium]|nr:EAL domain-containing protein [Thermoleophilaceae bacterium]
MSLEPSILLVDDNPENVATLQSVLEPIGVDCVPAYSGREALRHVLRQDFAAILLDVQMPGMDGLETAALIKRRARSCDTPIIFVTGHEHEPEMISRAFSLGAVDYVVKPYEPEHLRSKVRALVALHLKDAELRESEERFRAAFEHAPIGIAIVDCQGTWLDTNAALAELLGRSRDEMLTAPPFGLLHLSSAGEDDALDALITGDRRSFTVERRLFGAGGGVVWVAISVSLVRDRHGQPLHLICQVEDISERKAAEESMSKRIAYLAYHDELTGLPNRSTFREHLDLALARAARHGTAVAVLNLDLNRFKLVNDSLGHAAGDQLLREAGARLAGAVRASDLVARIGGDEFVVLLADLELGRERDVAELVARAIHDALARPFTISDAEFYIGTSIGIALYPTDTIGAPQADTEGLLRKADAAMYEAKQSGVPSVVCSERDDAPLERLELMTRLRRAADNDEFALHWLPIVDLDTGRACGAEALIRWYDTNGRCVLPSEFMELAEETGLIDQIGIWVVEEAARQLVAWDEAGLDLDVSVNISQRQLWRPGVAREMLEIIEAAGADPRRLVFELTETHAQHSADVPAAALSDLRAMGIRIAIDDFAHAPLTTLQQMDVDMLKIDRGLVASAATPEGELMLRAITQLAHNLGIWAVAEGVETREQYEALRRAGCRYGQGWYFGRAVPAAELSPALVPISQ